eukprot:CAMPEP_0198430134 /NCGR_PEP_ID=MMETSP1452-20131203/11807_1 /TAXON_ID=1181717 /ORGANISM="Synchroma pusillum, Strain CCMP3072" /LENGTH=42 /DNA_ID= /DNA_START= /DNA_END= /DNA_ORIENTATION=
MNMSKSRVLTVRGDVARRFRAANSAAASSAVPAGCDHSHHWL